MANLARALREEKIDLLINNAGLLEASSSFGKVDYDEWLEIFQVNSMAPLRLAERFVDHVAGSDLKLIVNVSSTMGSIGENDSGGSYIYRSSKAALNMVTRSLAIDLAPRGITVIAVHPGWVRTDMGGKDGRLSPEEAAADLRRLFGDLRPEDSGTFINHDGRRIGW